ncbi:collagen-like triple helix repeat-containing protein [Clostridium rectalis]|uniref:collagen-like triple helix repeat-containing protein n=1 Tax=Clostridium rectalis TaxID=2040295 RepID=UPI000F63DF4C|nr:collagen-like protein [Clostridium rectalis]
MKNRCNKTICIQGCGRCTCPRGITGPTGPTGLQGVTGVTGPTGPQVLIVYGGLYNDAIQTIAVDPGVIEMISIPKAMPINNVTLGADTVIIDVTGKYLVEFTVFLNSAGGGGITTIGVQINGTFSEPSLVTTTLIDSNFKCITFSSIVTLAKDDELTLAISNTIATTFFLEAGMNANLNVLLLGS